MKELNKFELVTLDSVNEALINLFGKDLIEKSTTQEYYWGNQTLLKLINNVVGDIKLEKIEKWDGYESGDYEIEEAYFLNQLFGKDKSLLNESNLIIVTDDSLSKQKAVLLEMQDLDDLISRSYFDLFEASFFNIFDIVFIGVDTGSIAIITHEGYYLPFTQMVEI